MHAIDCTHRARTTLLAIVILLAASGVLTAQGLAPHTAKPPRPERALDGVVLVKVTQARMRQGVSVRTFGSIAERYGITAVIPWLKPELVNHGRPLLKISALDDPASRLLRIMEVQFQASVRPEEVARALETLDGVEYAEAIHPRHLAYNPNDLEIGKQWYLDAIHAREAWDVQRADSSIIIAITDTGIQPGHPDLRNAIWTNAGETGTGPNGDMRYDGVDNDNNGFVDDWRGYDFAGPNGISPDNDPSATGDQHGVLVAGTAAATGNNAEGIAGVAFGARIMAVKVSDDRLFPQTKIFNGAQGVLYAAKMGARIINCSWGSTFPSRAEREVVEHVTKDLGVIVVAASGNDGRDIQYYPASYAGVFSVASTTAGNTRADFSNYGYRIDLCAPGTDIYATTDENAYIYDSGTSFSAPIVSAVAALVAQRYPALSAAQVCQILRSTCTDISSTLGADANKMGAGLVNAQAALTTGPSIAAARMVGYQLVEQFPNGGADAGEQLRIAADIQNLLAPATDVVVTMECVSDANIQIAGNNEALGAMAAGEKRTTGATSFGFQVPANIAPNTPIVLKITSTTPDRAATQYITLVGSPTYLTTDHNDVALTFNSSGNLGHDGLDQRRGDGFVYNGSIDLLFHGGLMVGTDMDHLADVVRVGRLIDGIADGFHIVDPYRLSVSPGGLVQNGIARFNDAHLDAAARVGVEITMRTSEYRSPELANIVLVEYAIRNMGATRLDSLRCGLYLDFDVSANSYGDQVAFAPDSRLAFQREAAAPAPATIVGATVLTGSSMNFYGIDNEGDGITESFSPRMKWEAMSTGVRTIATINDMAMVVSNEAIGLDPNETRKVAFALMAAKTYDSLRLAADRARELYAGISTVASTTAPGGILVTAAPNPFLRETYLAVESAGGDARLELIDTRGSVVVNTGLGRVEPGRQTLFVPARGLAAGLYFYRLVIGNTIATGSVVKSSGD